MYIYIYIYIHTCIYIIYNMYTYQCLFLVRSRCKSGRHTTILHTVVTWSLTLFYITSTYPLFQLDVKAKLLSHRDAVQVRPWLSIASRGPFQGGNLSYQRNLMLFPVDSDWMFIARNSISHWLHTRTLLIYCFNHLQITVFWWACSFTNDMGSRSH